MTYRELLGKLCVLTLALLLGSVVMPQPCSAQKRPTPLTRDYVFELLSAKMPPELLDMMARDNGIDFPITPEIENRLLKAGATPELLATLQGVAPRPVAPPKSAQIVIETQADAQVYLDDTFKGQASSQGRLVIENATPGQHVLRISMTGKKDYEQSIALVAGQDAYVSAPLESLAGSIRVRASMPAQVHLDDFDRGSTDPNGQWVMPDIAPGMHVIRVSAEGKKDFRQTVDVRPGHESVVDAALAAVNQPPPGAAPGSPEQKPWTKDQIIRMLKGDVPPKRIGELARERGIDFQITAENEAEIRHASPNGAATQEVDGLVVTLREIAPKPAAPPALEPSVLLIESTPGSVQVYLDDEFKGATSQEGKLKITGLPAGQHRVRLSLPGYDDKEDQVEIVAGATQTYRAELAEHAQPDAQPKAVAPTGAARGATVGGGSPRSVQVQPATPATTEVEVPAPALATFQIFHLVWGRHNWHPGTLVMYPGRVTWNESGQDSKPEDDFSITCGEIVDIGKNSGLGYSSLKTRTNNYHFSGNGRTVKGFADAFAAACPGLGIH